LQEAIVWNCRVVGVAAVTAIAVAVQACGGGTPEAGAPGAAASTAAPAESAAPKVTVRTADVPADECGWIAVADVEAVVGKLAEPPSKSNGCRYVMTVPPEIAEERRKHVERIAAFQAKFKTEVPTFHGPMANFQSNPKSYAVSVSVDVGGEMAGEIGLSAGMAHLAREMGGRPQKAAPPEGWDSVGGLPYGFSGRVGHVRVSVQAEAPDVPKEVMQRLAAAVRDRIPDLPFKTDNPYQIIQFGASDKNPCDLLTRAEAEAVLGPLVVEPYRASSQHPPLALAEGHACSYYTKGHRVFSVIPTWSDGDETFNIEAGVGGLMSQVLPQEMVVFKGPWDKAQPSRGSGALLFLKGERLLEVHYMGSSTDRGGAVKLAAAAMRRLAE
jgi:hypothetical protein